MSFGRASLLVYLLAATALAAQQPPGFASPSPTAQASPDPSQPVVPTIATTARQVVLDVVVTDSHGHPIKGLKPSDFVLSEDGVPQTLANFVEHDSESTAPLAATEPVLPPNTFADHAPMPADMPVTVVLFDEVSFSDAAYARYEVERFMKSLAPGMPICIFKLDWQGLHLIQDFTSDPQMLSAAVTSKRNSQILPLPAYVRQTASMRPYAMGQLASYLSSFSGRKNLIWITGGATPTISVGGPGGLFPDMQDILRNDKGVTDALTLNRVALYPIDARGLVTDPGEGFAIAAQGGSLEELAESTGGRAFYNTNGLKEAVAEVVATGSSYYTLSYTPTNPNWDGRFRKIKVQTASTVELGPLQKFANWLNGAPVRLEYRPGYYARWAGPLRVRSAIQMQAPQTQRQMISYSPNGDPDGRGRATATPIQAAMSFGAVAPFQVLFTVTATPSRTVEANKHNAPLPKNTFLSPEFSKSPYRLYTLHYSIRPKDLQFSSQTVGSYADSLEFIAVLYTDTGRVANSLAGHANMEVNATGYGQIVRSGLGYEMTIAIPTNGNFFPRAGVYDLTSDRIGALEIPVEAIKLPSKRDARTKP
jgi:VWFA-related protein